MTVFKGVRNYHQTQKYQTWSFN